MRKSLLILTVACFLLAGAPASSAEAETCNDPHANGEIVVPSLEALNGDGNTYYLYLNFEAGTGVPLIQWWKEDNHQAGLQTKRLVCDGFPVDDPDKLLDAAPLP